VSAPVEQGGALAGGLRAGASELGLSLAPPQVDQLLAYLALISKWNRVYNLTAVREPGEMLTQHLLDSLAIVLPLQRQLGGRPASVLDVGAGAGLPGVALAVACPQLQVSCVDAVAKKVSFIRQAAAELGLRNLQAVHARVEGLAPKTWDVITSRAFASLPDFVAWTRGSLAQGGVWLAMKGKRPDAEIAELPEDIEVFHVEHLQVPGLEAERCIVWMRHKN
jgi:16S rRNA (guanine527-N7)-methyltransferase